MFLSVVEQQQQPEPSWRGRHGPLTRLHSVEQGGFRSAEDQTDRLLGADV